MTKYNISGLIFEYMCVKNQVSVVGKYRFSKFYILKDNLSISKIGLFRNSALPTNAGVNVTYRLSKIGNIKK